MPRRSVLPATCLAAIMTLVIALPTAMATTHQKTRAVRQDAQLVVQAVALGLAGILQNVQAREDQILMIRDFIRPARFFPDGSGYFFVFDTNGICIAHGGNKKLEGQNMYDFKDADGFPAVKAIIEQGAKGGGFLEYSWHKPGSDGVFKKLGYVEPIQGTNYIIGSGVYFPDPW